MLTRRPGTTAHERFWSFRSFPDAPFTLAETEEAFIRFANNGVTTSGFTASEPSSISGDPRREDRVTQTTDLTDEALKAAMSGLKRSPLIAPPNPEDVRRWGRRSTRIRELRDERQFGSIAHDDPHVKSIIDAAVKRSWYRPVSSTGRPRRTRSETRRETSDISTGRFATRPRQFAGRTGQVRGGPDSRRCG